MKLAIVVGHEKLKPGAAIGAPLNTSEYSYNKQIAALMFIFSKDKQLDCQIFFRDKIGITGAAKNVNAWIGNEKNACIMELHCNSVADKNVSGTETLFSMDHDKSIELARIVQSNVCAVFKRLGKQNRGIKSLDEGDRGAVNLGLYQSASVITEPAFGSNVSDCRLLWSNTAGYSKALVNSAITFLEGLRDAKF